MQLPHICLPAKVNIIVSLISFVLIIISTALSNSETVFSFISWIFYLLHCIFWTWILNLLCINGYSYISWFIVLLPWLIFFVIFMYYFIYEIQSSSQPASQPATQPATQPETTKK
jgi:hypothetical protein